MNIPPLQRGIHPLGTFDPIQPDSPHAGNPYRNRDKHTPSQPASKNAPWSRQARQAATGAATWLQAAMDAEAAFRLVTSPATSAWEQPVVQTSDPDSVTGSALADAATRLVFVQAEQLAVGQMNKGYTLPRDGSSIVEPGLHTLLLTAGGQSIEASVMIAPADTNAHALAKIRSVILSAGIGLTAEVEADKDERTVRLEVTGTLTGSGESFSITDHTGSAAASSGIQTIAREAGDARFRIDGGPPADAPSNTVSLYAGTVKLTFHKITEHPVKVEIGPDLKAVAGQLEEAVLRLAALAGVFDRFAGYLHDSLPGRLEAAVFTGEAAQLGISKNENGHALLNTSLLIELAEVSPELVRFQMRDETGWAENVHRLLQQFRELPVVELLDPNAPALSGYTLYRPGREVHWQLPTYGLVVNDLS
ncbi:hypothetical protein DNH61_25920 [Paenibacillus sambharensis]|uniref:Uncharacterized protein n=1 Tax=Paenibacillus sambharensis TaxID=1803190 RepID=A0A2W1LMC8_9BACL|nr:hypothetical protein [Paenibacillus sambharensis]PZD92931.1 hypothetical protein DNH61_25920 [Paenibacillus sambharensis]